MAKKKVSAFTLTTDMGEDDNFPIVLDVLSTPKSRRLALKSLRNRLYGQSVYIRPTGGDDTATLNAAFAALTPGTRVIMRGSYSVSDTFTLAVDDTIVDMDGATITQTGLDKRTLTLDTVDRCKVLGGRFIGKGTETPWAGGATAENNVAAIRMVNCTHCDVIGCEIENHAGCGIAIDGTAEIIHIRSNRITGVGTHSVGDNGSDAAIRGGAASVAKTGIIVRHNDISHHAFGVMIPGVIDCIIEGNHIHDITGQHSIYQVACGDQVIANNLIRNGAQDGIKVQLQDVLDMYGTISITGNVVKNCGYTSGKAGINVLAVGAGVLGVKFEWCINIASNNVYKASYGILVRGCRNCNVASNRVSDIALYGYDAHYSEVSFHGNYAANCDRAPLYIQYPTNTVYVNGMTIVDGPRNMAGGTGYDSRCCIFIDDEASPNNGNVYLSNITCKFENYTEQAGTGPFYGCIYATANTQVHLVGPIVNLTTKVNYLNGTTKTAVPFDVGSAPTAATNKAYLYGADVAAGNTAIHAMTEGGKVIKLYQQAHIADAVGGTEIATINAILAALENAGFLATS